MLEFAIPSKGRLQQDSLAFLKSIGLAVQASPGDRSYRAAVSGLANVSLWLLSSDEIAKRLHAGEIHAGLIGEDLLHEHADIAGAVDVLRRLPFGFADLVVAAPSSWIDVQTMADLKDVFQRIRTRHGRPGVVATKYVRQATRFFRACGFEDFRVVRSLGATEAAPASGAADVIVDITTTGETLRANHLRPLAIKPILRSQVLIAASLKAAWTSPAIDALETILDRQLAAADRSHIVQVALGAAGAQARAAQGETSAFVDRKESLDAAARLRTVTGEAVAVLAPEFVFRKSADALAAIRATLNDPAANI